MLQCSCVILLVKKIYSCWKIEGVFANISEPVIKKINSSPLNNENILLACKSEIPSIVKTLNKIMITRNVYSGFLSSWYDERYVEPIIKKFQLFCQTFLQRRDTGFEHRDFFWNEVKEIWCTRKLLVLFCLGFLKWRNQSSLSLFQYFEQKRCVYWIFYLASWSLTDVSLLSNFLFLVWSIEIGGVELLGVEKIFRRWIMKLLFEKKNYKSYRPYWNTKL